MDRINKEQFIVKTIIKKLAKDIDISDEDVGIGKAVYNDLEVDDEDTKYFIEFYCEIPTKNMEVYSNYFEQSLEDFIRDCKKIIKDRIVWIVCSLFNKQEALKQYNPNMEDLELDIGMEKEFFIVQVNITAESQEIKDGKF